MYFGGEWRWGRPTATGAKRAILPSFRNSTTGEPQRHWSPRKNSMFRPAYFQRLNLFAAGDSMRGGESIRRWHISPMQLQTLSKAELSTRYPVGASLTDVLHPPGLSRRLRLTWNLAIHELRSG